MKTREEIEKASYKYIDSLNEQVTVSEAFIAGAEYIIKAIEDERSSIPRV